MKRLISQLQFVKRILLTGILFFPILLMAEGNWPKEIKTAKSTTIIYQPKHDSIKGDHLNSRAAISFTTSKITTPVFGAAWIDSRFSTDRETGLCSIFEVKILNVRFPGVDTLDPAKVQKYKQILAEGATSWNLEFSFDELKSSLAVNTVAIHTSEKFKNGPPEIIFVKQLSVLVFFDGDPVLKETDNAGIKRVINIPFLVLQDMKDKSQDQTGRTDPVKG
jgi:hypothetical protein